MVSFNQIPGLQVGHAHNLEAVTGCTVAITPAGAVCGVDQRGGAPGTRETDLIRPLRRVEAVHAVLLTGGSAFGLAAADGVIRWLEEHDIGYDVGVARVPIVPGAVIFDLALGRADVRPDADMGYAACEAAQTSPAKEQAGTVGAGVGATIGNILGAQAQMKGGLGSAVIQVTPDLLVGAMMVVNCFGDVIDPKTGQILAGARKLPDGGFADTLKLLPEFDPTQARSTNTVIGVVGTNAALSKEAINKVAQMAHNGLARTIRPAHTMFDGDTIFALATGQGQPADTSVVGAYAAEAVAQAIINGVRRATSLPGAPALRDLKT